MKTTGINFIICGNNITKCIENIVNLLVDANLIPTLNESFDP